MDHVSRSCDTPAPSPDDAALVRRAAQEASAFAELYRRHTDRVYRYLLARTGNRQDAQELTADTFLTAYQDLARFRGEGTFAAWLLGIARHHASRLFRRRRETFDLDALGELWLGEVGLDERVAKQLQMEQVIAALRRLSPERAEALRLRVLAELPAAEVGRIMGKSETAVRMLVYRALRDLRRQLAHMREGAS
ncbi:MAG TPA: RNA polymerase sigma factor [Chloroflexota bacterium]|nr:RNA polymerase sigma factor [Chloroflexota bacterium]